MLRGPSLVTLASSIENLREFLIVNISIVIFVIVVEERLKILGIKLGTYSFSVVETNLLKSLGEGVVVKSACIVNVKEFEAFDKESFLCHLLPALLKNLVLELFLKPTDY